MPCINPDGTPTESGRKMSQALKKGAGTPEEVAKETGLPLFRARSGLRDMAESGFAEVKGEGYKISSKGIELIK